VARVNLPFYLFWQRIWVWWNGEKTALWRFALRLDGTFGPDAVARITESLRTSPEFSGWESQLISANDREARVKVDRTIHLHISYEPEFLSGDGEDHLFIRSDELEVPYGRARQKIDRQITPLLSAFIGSLHARDYSIIFDVMFPDRNPFFAFYIAHLRPEQVTQFNLVFKPRDVSRTNAEKIVVTQQALEITAVTTEGFSEMAKAFVLLTGDAIRVAKGV
jgi:hypothetical protein